MFGPNHSPSIHHREPAFEKVYRSLIDNFRKTFNISEEMTILPLTGSGTYAINMVLESLTVKPYVHYSGDEFGARLLDMRDINKPTGIDAATLYETSISKYHKIPAMRKVGKYNFLDCVSAFPYYDVPEDTDIWCTVNSKQIGADPGVSFVVLNDRIKDFIKPPKIGYLNLAKQIKYEKINQTPNTPAIQNFIDTNNTIKCFDLQYHREQIDYRRNQLEKLLGVKGGEGPVFSMELEPRFVKMQEEFGLYGRKCIQIFLWSGYDSQYENLFNYIRRNL